MVRGTEPRLFDFALSDIGAQVAVDAFDKASFGGDRSAAGRYAAEQRWKNHRKKDEGGKGRSERREKFSANLKRVQGLVAEAEQATAGDTIGGYKPLPSSAFLTTEQMQRNTALYDEVTGLTLVFMSIPQQKTKGGELATTTPRWSTEEMLKLTTVFVPSPEAMALEQEVQRVGAEALAIAEEELTAQGITEQSVTDERDAKHSEINKVTREAQKILDVYNTSGSEPDYSLVDEATARLAKETRAAQQAYFLADRAELVARNAFADASRSGQNRDIVDRLRSEALMARDKTQQSEQLFLGLQEKLRRSQYDNPDLNRLAQKEGELRDELANIKTYTERRYEVVHSLLREERNFGDVEPNIRAGAMSDNIANETYSNVKKYIPSQIIDLVNQQGDITVLSNAMSSGGGWWDGQSRVLMTGGRPQVQLHEYIHAISQTNPVAKLIEQATAARRTIGNPTTRKDGKFDSADLMAGRQKVSRSTRYQGMKYDFDHVKDDFAEPYAGRLYDHISGEVLTVGHDLAFTDDRTREFGIVRRDDDLSASVIGLLFTLGSGQ